MRGMMMDVMVRPEGSRDMWKLSRSFNTKDPLAAVRWEADARWPRHAMGSVRILNQGGTHRFMVHGPSGEQLDILCRPSK